MTQDKIQIIRENYDRVADEYAHQLFSELERKPLDRELLRRFTDAVVGRGRVCDMGCGPGQVARLLQENGADVFGLDLSAQMIEQARTLSPDIHFHEGNMLGLNLEDCALAGITAFYAIVNIPRELLSTVFREMHRVLKADGLLLLAFHIGDEVLRPEELWGKAISMDFYHLRPEKVQNLLEEAGFKIEEVIEREPYPPEVEYQSRRAYVFARKAAAPTQP